MKKKKTKFDVIGSKLWVIHMYQDQLDKFMKIGLGNKTENNVVVTETLINTTKKRLAQLTIVYEAGIKTNSRWQTAYKVTKEKLSNDTIDDNGTIITSGRQDDSNNGHDGDGS